MHPGKSTRWAAALGAGILLASGCSGPESAGLQDQSVTAAAETTTTVNEQDNAAAAATTSQTEQPVTTQPLADPSHCPTIGPDRNDVVIGPVFLCSNTSPAGFGGRSVPRPGTDNAEAALLAWLDGPTEQERSEGLQGWNLQNHPWFADALTVRREGSTLIMELDQWEPIGNLSTSNGSAVFVTSLLATAFSDPTVEKFDLSIRGDNCPVYIGDAEMCFPIEWDDLMNMNPPG